MKFLAVIAALAVAEGHRISGIDKGDLMQSQPSHWRKGWPQGAIDDSTDDDKIMNWMREPKPPAPPIQYHDKMRQWTPGTWPVHFVWNGDFNHATYHKQIDDGTDDNEVVDLMHRTQGI